MIWHCILHSFRPLILSVCGTAVAGAEMLQDGWKQKSPSFLLGSVTGLLHSTLLARAQKCFGSTALLCPFFHLHRLCGHPPLFPHAPCILLPVFQCSCNSAVAAFCLPCPIQYISCVCFLSLAFFTSMAIDSHVFGISKTAFPSSPDVCCSGS